MVGSRCMHKRGVQSVILGVLCLLSSGCGQTSDDPAPGGNTSPVTPASIDSGGMNSGGMNSGGMNSGGMNSGGTGPASADAAGVLRLATTTSTRDSGLLDLLVPEFEKQHGCRVDVIAVGTGAALKLGEAGDVDAVLVHARTAEEAFMAAGHGLRHEPVMRNYFLIAGPASDPAGVSGFKADNALARIAESEQRFVSRGDDSGTHKRELSLWKSAGGRPDWQNYIESGQGMGPTLTMADEMNAYVLADDATWLRQSSGFQLVPLISGSEELSNPYAVMSVNPDKHPDINGKLADAFVDFMISPETQALIGGYRINDQSLFQPDRLPPGSETGSPATTPSTTEEPNR